MFRLFLCLVCGLGTFFGVPFSSVAAQEAHAPEAAVPAPMETGNEQPWTVTADNMVSLDDGVIVEASGNVVLERGTDTLKADFARYFTTTDWVFVKGNVVVRMGRDELQATEAEFDLNSSTGWLKNGTVFMAGPHIYFAGENVIKHWGDRYTFENAKVTACDGPTPAWSVSAQEAVVELDGYATLSHSTFQVKDQGVLYSPYMVLPAKTTRQTGLLKPDYGYSSLHGTYYTQPWFWAIDESRDLTVYGTWLSRTGFMPAVEYRSHTADQDKTWLALDLLYDKNPFRLDADDPIDDTDGKVRTNRERYWLRGMSEGQIGNSPWYYKYDADYVSDQNFLREFQQRLTGFDTTRRSLAEYFGRDLQELDKNRVSEGYIYRDWERFRVSFGGRYEEEPSIGHGNGSHRQDTTVQRLPGFNAYLYKGRLVPALPLELEAEVDSAYMYRALGTHGLRTEVYPRLSLPLDVKYATMIATAGLRQTFYNNGHVKGGGTSSTTQPRWERGGGERRTVPDFDLNAFTQANKIWQISRAKPLEATPANAGRRQWTSIRHLVQPRFQYSWIPNVDQTHNPYYTEDDRLLPTNRMLFSVDNLLTVRRQAVVADPAPQGQQPTTASLVPEYLDFARLRLGSGYDIGEAGRTRHIDLYPRRPMLDLFADLTISPTSWLSFWTQTYLSLYDGDITRSDQGLSLTNARWGTWSLGYSARNRYYDYARKVQRDSLWDIQFEEPLSLLTSDITLHLYSKLHAGYYTSTNLRTNRNYERRFSLFYTDQCYTLIGQYVSKGKERSFQFSIQLLGIND